MKTTKVVRQPPLSISDSMIFEGDALTVLQRLPDQQAQCIVTSPPTGA